MSSTSDILDRLHRRIWHVGTSIDVEEGGEPRMFGGYRLLERLGQGAFGSVFRAHDPKLERDVALKLTWARGNERDLHEARALAAVKHPNVVSVHASDVVDDKVAISMELIDGSPLDAWIAGRPSVRAVLGVLHQIGSGLVAIHAAGLEHGDVKPDNVMVTSDGRAVLVDLGLARAKGPAGSFDWMAPEVHAGAAANARSDQYSFALVVRWALEQIGAPRRAWRFLRRALRANPDERWPTLAEGLGSLPHKDAGRWRSVMLVAGLVGVAVGAIGGRSCSSGEGGSTVPAWFELITTMREAEEFAKQGSVRLLRGHCHDAYNKHAQARGKLRTLSPSIAAWSSERVAEALVECASEPLEMLYAGFVFIAAAEAHEDSGEHGHAKRLRRRADMLLAVAGDKKAIERVSAQ